MIFALIGCLIIIGFLGFKLFQKQKIDKEEYQLYQDQLKQVKQDVKDIWTEFHLASQNLETVNNTLKCAKEKTEYEKYKLEECKKDLQAALDVYQDLTDNKLKELDASMEEQRQKRQGDLELALLTKTNENNQEIARLEEILKNTRAETEALATEYWAKVNQNKQKFESTLEVLRKYDLEQQEKLFYTIQLKPEYQEDIEFLLTTVASTVRHPDIINKLVWQEYVKPNLEDTFKRIEIKAEPGIYKLTSLLNGKCYIGKSTNVKNRLTDHFKAVIGIANIADQAVHHAIRKEGFWNWTIEIITYCDKDELSDLEKYYIDFFKGQEFGYNKNAGG